ncbi:MAG: transketolase, partial [Clostridiales bacterium]|nr:transketolase [Clostridiales bacterium]
DGNDTDAIGRAIEEAKADTARPSFIRIHTHIGYGVPAKQDTAAAHGEPLGEENIRVLRKNLDWPDETPFAVPVEVYAHYRALAEKGAQAYAAWTALRESYIQADKASYDRFLAYLHAETPEETLRRLESPAAQEKPDATRNIAGAILNSMKDDLPWLMGGSADLAPSTKAAFAGETGFSKETPEGRNIHFGVRELGMGAICLGLALHGGVLPFAATFFVFSDYMKPMIRLAALMRLPILFWFTHDSIGVGEDGPTHEPVEQLAMLRALPDFTVFRPADVNETQAAFRAALAAKRPAAFVLTRQNLPPVCDDPKKALRGGYVVSAEKGGTPDVLLIATGSEVSLAIDAQALLAAQGIDARVVSIPSTETFEAQPVAYRDSVLPPAVRARVAVEAGSRLCWGAYTGLDGKTVTMDSFGASAPAAELFRHFGFTAEHVAETAAALVREG